MTYFSNSSLSTMSTRDKWLFLVLTVKPLLGFSTAFSQSIYYDPFSKHILMCWHEELITFYTFP